MNFSDYITHRVGNIVFPLQFYFLIFHEMQLSAPPLLTASRFEQRK